MDPTMDAIPQTMDRTPSKPPLKRGSISMLAPSPAFREASEPERRLSSTINTPKDDITVPSPSPQTPRRPDFLSRGLSLQLPPRTMSMAAPGSAQRAPLSPQLDPLTSYASPQTSLPRHSRGLDFSRACTNLHHSTLAEQSSPDSSPIITQKGIGIPSRKASVSSMMLDSPNLVPGANWPQMSVSLNDRSAVSSSVGSVNMLGSGSDSDSDSGGDDLMGPDDADDAIYATPQAHKLNHLSAPTPFNPSTASPTAMWSNNFSPAHASLMKNFQRVRFKKGRSRKSSSSASASASGPSAMPSPRTTSPPPLRSIESGGYFGWSRLGNSRRGSLALGADQLNISSGNDSGDEAGPANPSTPGVVKRAVTRRGNLLPKTKGFARIRAALMEESMPVDAEVRREAETIRQVRERDTDVDLDGPSLSASSPGLMPTVPGGVDGLEDIPEDMAMGMAMDNNHSSAVHAHNKAGGNNNNNNNNGPTISFNIHASKNSAGLNYWNKFDKDLRTPPPPSFPPRNSSSMSGDINMDSPNAASASLNVRSASVVSMSDDTIPPYHSNQPQLFPSSFATSQQGGDAFTRRFGKRRREDDFDLASIKRRAVSPSLSVHNSPIVSTASPARSDIIASREGAQSAMMATSSSAAMMMGWGQPPRSSVTRESSMSTSGSGMSLDNGRSNSGSIGSGSTATMGPLLTNGPTKRVGLQGMVDTNDGIMKMSIE